MLAGISSSLLLLAGLLLLLLVLLLLAFPLDSQLHWRIT